MAEPSSTDRGAEPLRRRLAATGRPPQPRTCPPAWVWLLLACGAHAGALAGEPVFDDELNFARNVALRDGDVGALCVQPFFRPELGYWRPATSLAMAAAHGLGGPLGVHALALAVHTAATFVAFRIAGRVLGDRAAALGAALLFALHPAQVEGVAWASALADPLCALATLLAVDAALAWRAAPRPSLPWCVAGATLCALLAKETGVVAVPLVLLVVAAPGSRRGRVAPVAAALLAATVPWLSLRALALGGVVAGPEVPALAPWVWAAGAADAVVRQLAMLAVPWPSTPFRALHDAEAAPGTAVAFAAAAAAVVASALLLHRHGPPVLRLGAALVVVPLLLPALLHAQLGDHPIADRYLCVPVLGFALCAMACIGRRRWPVVVVVAAYATGTVVQTGVWRDPPTFAAHALKHAPDSAMVQVLAANVHLAAARRGDATRIVSARTAFARASAIAGASRSPSAPRNGAIAAIGLAWCALLEQQRNGCVVPGPLVRRFRAALAIDPEAAGGWVGLGVAHALAREFDAAESAFSRALQVDPLCTEAWFNRGYMQLELGALRQARASLERALQCDPRLDAAAELLATLR